MFEFIVFHTTPSALSLAGAAIIISSAIYVSVRYSLHPVLTPAYAPPDDKKGRRRNGHLAHPGAATTHPSRQPRRSAAVIAMTSCTPCFDGLPQSPRLWAPRTGSITGRAFAMSNIRCNLMSYCDVGIPRGRYIVFESPTANREMTILFWKQV